MEQYLDQKILKIDMKIRQIVELMQCDQWIKLAGSGCENIADIRLECLSGKGFASAVARITFHFRHINEPFSVVLKYPTTAILLEEQQPKEKEEAIIEKLSALLVSCHRREVHFYSKIARSFLRDLAFIPRVYAWKDSPSGAQELDGQFLLMEDLGAKGGHNKPEGKGLTKGQVESMIKAMAMFHERSLSIPRDLILSQHQLGFSHFQKDTEGVLNSICQMPDPVGQYFQKHSKAVRNFLEQTEPAGWDFDAQLAEKFGFSEKILTHGDLWINNLLFQKEGENGEEAGQQIEAILDWQVVHIGTGVNDLAHFVLLNTDSELRRANEEHWLALYHGTFEEQSAKGRGERGQCPLDNMDTVRQIYRLQFPAEVHFILAMEAFFFRRPMNSSAEDRENLRKNGRQRAMDAFEQIREEYE